jgi:hypothetical protein
MPACAHARDRFTCWQRGRAPGQHDQLAVAVDVGPGVSEVELFELAAAFVELGMVIHAAGDDGRADSMVAQAGGGVFAAGAFRAGPWARRRRRHRQSAGSRPDRTAPGLRLPASRSLRVALDCSPGLAQALVAEYHRRASAGLRSRCTAHCVVVYAIADAVGGQYQARCIAVGCRDTAMFRSDCSDRVGMPVEGPPRITSTTTTGISAWVARPSASTISEKPGPDVAVIAGVPPKRGAQAHVDRGQFVLGLDQTGRRGSGRLGGQPFLDLGRGRDGVGGREAHPAMHRAQARRLRCRSSASAARRRSGLTGR